MPSIPVVAKQLAAEDSDAKLEAINKLIAAAGDTAAIPILKAMQDDALRYSTGGLVIVAGSVVKRCADRRSRLTRQPDKLEAIMVNNRIRGALDGAIAALKLVSPQREERLAAAKAVASDPASEEMLPLIKTRTGKGNRC